MHSYDSTSAKLKSYTVSQPLPRTQQPSHAQQRQQCSKRLVYLPTHTPHTPTKARHTHSHSRNKTPLNQAHILGDVLPGRSDHPLRSVRPPRAEQSSTLAFQPARTRSATAWFARDGRSRLMASRAPLCGLLTGFLDLVPSGLMRPRGSTFHQYYSTGNPRLWRHALSPGAPVLDDVPQASFSCPRFIQAGTIVLSSQAVLVVMGAWEVSVWRKGGCYLVMYLGTTATRRKVG